jgi:leucyl aminopeptidase
MKISLTNTSVFSQKLPAVALFAFEKERLAGPNSFKNLLQRLTDKEFKGAEKQLLLLHTAGKPGIQAGRVLLAGLGKRNEFSPEKMRRAMGAVVKELRDIGIDRAAVQIACDEPHCSIDDCIAAVVDSAELVAYRFTRYKADKDEPIEFRLLTLCLPAQFDLRGAKELVRRTQTVAGSANYARDIANLPGNVVFPSALADYARQLAEENNLKCTVLDRNALDQGGFGGLLAVGGGSAHEPQLIVLEYQPPVTSHQLPIALVGKAITFDSGGISIKPSDKMDEMKFDKCGGVAVLGAMRAIAQLKLPLSVIGVIAAAENMPSATSYRPGDIVTSYRGADNKRGVTIEVLNTDAEGRIVLGDALAYARERKPQAIIDLATLTGACVVALGCYATGLFGNNEPLLEKLRAAGERTGERLWPFPLWQEYKDKIKSDVADHKNTGGREGGAITAAAFLARYVGDVPWAHLDIAGTAWTTEERPYMAKGATGFGVRLLLELLGNWR